MRGIALIGVLLLGGLACETPIGAGDGAEGHLGPFLAEVVGLAEGGQTERAHQRAAALGLRPGGGEAFLVTAIAEHAQGTRAVGVERLQAAGAEVVASSRSLLRVRFALLDAGAVAAVPGIGHLRAPAQPREVGFGDVVSEAVSLTGAGELHDAGFDGSGVRVAVIDSGFQGLSEAIEAGELPDTTIAVLGGTEVAWGDLENTSQHGSGVAEHVMDMAPGASLYCIQVTDEVDYENAVDYLAAEGVEVVNQSLAWGGQSYYDDSGPISSLVNTSRDDHGVFWAVSSGNYAAKHWRGLWSDGGDDLLDFDGDDHELALSEGPYSGVSVYLNWDQYHEPLTNLDLYVHTVDGDLKASSEIEQSALTGYWPVEAVSFEYDDSEDPYQITVEQRWGSTTDLDVTLFSFTNDIEHPVAQASLVEPAEAHGAFTCGAVSRGEWGDDDPAIEGFSSQGPTTDGRLKPELVGPDRTSTHTYGEHAGWGTSFASPTVAGAAALLLSRDPAMTADSIDATLRFMARDAGDAGHDAAFGAGLLTLEDAEPCVDVDGDGYGVGAFANAACGQADLDCDDDDESIHPGAGDTWYDGVDSDCDGASDFDADGDGFDSDGFDGDDCDDGDDAIHPDAEEQYYDGVDADCDGASDFDADGDGFDSDGYDGDDCDDGDPELNPDQDEICDDGLDNDCDGEADLEDGDCVAGDDDDSSSDDDDDTTEPDDDDDDATTPLDEDGSDCSCQQARRGPGPGLLVVLSLVTWLATRPRQPGIS